MNHKEDDEQAALFEWAAYQRYYSQPLTDFMFAIPNGGNRNVREAARMKQQGVKAGVFDIFLAIPLHGWHGLFIEMKVDDNTLSADQQEFELNMLRNGYSCVVCYCAEDAIIEINAYLQKKAFDVYIREYPGGNYPFFAKCRNMKKNFKTRRGAIGWLRRRGFDEEGNRIKS